MLPGAPSSRRPNSQAKYPRLPIHNRWAIQASVIAVSERNSRASATLLGCPLRFALRTASVQASRFRPSTTTARPAPPPLPAPLPRSDSTPAGRSSAPATPAGTASPRHQPLSTGLNSSSAPARRRHSIRSPNTRRPARLSFAMPYSPSSRSARNQGRRAEGPSDSPGNCSSRIPRAAASRREQLCPRGIQMDVIAHAFEIAAAAAVHQQRLIPAAKQVPK